MGIIYSANPDCVTVKSLTYGQMLYKDAGRSWSCVLISTFNYCAGDTTNQVSAETELEQKALGE